MEKTKQRIFTAKFSRLLNYKSGKRNKNMNATKLHSTCNKIIIKINMKESEIYSDSLHRKLIASACFYSVTSPRQILLRAHTKILGLWDRMEGGLRVPIFSLYRSDVE